MNEQEEFEFRLRLEQESAAQPAAVPAKPTLDLSKEGLAKIRGYNPTDSIAGQVRGAGSIGATLMAPFDYAEQKLTDWIAGPQNRPTSLNQQRRADMDAGLQSLGADPSSTQFQANKLIVEAAGTSGAGAGASALLSKIPGATVQIPHLLQAIRTGGMTTGAPAGASRVADMGVRMAGGGVNGALMAGAVDQNDAGTGAVIGSLFPPVAKVLGAAGGAVGSAFRRAHTANPTTLQTAKESIEAGYVIPPNMVNPSLKNQVIESISGKQATQQIASTRNTEVTERLTREALGIATDVPLTNATLENLRKTAGRAYAEVSALSPQAATDLEALKIARNEASAQFKFYNRSADPKALAEAKAARTLSDSLETALEGHAQAAGRPELIPALRNARREIAKTYTVGRALNDASGTVDARVLGRMHEKGLPLSGGLDVAGKFASAFPTIAKSPQQVGSPAAHNLKAGLSALMAGGGYLGMGPLGVAAAAVPFVAPPVARSIMFSKGAQRGLLGAGQSGGLLGNSLDEALPLMYQFNPLLAGRSGQ